MRICVVLFILAAPVPTVSATEVKVATTDQLASAVKLAAEGDTISISLPANTS